MTTLYKQRRVRGDKGGEIFRKLVFGEISGKKKGGIAIQFDVIKKFLRRNVKIDLNRSERRREEKFTTIG